MKRPILLSAFLLLSLTACEALPSAPSAPLYTEHELLLPGIFEGSRLLDVRRPTAEEAEFPSRVYARDDGVLAFSYEDRAITGFVISYDTPFEAQRAHDRARERLGGHSWVPSELTTGRTLFNYGTRFFYEGTAAYIFHHIGSDCLIYAAPPDSIGAHSLQRVVAFTESLFRTNELWDTVPERPVEVEIVASNPPVGGAIQPEPQLTVTFTVRYRLAEYDEGSIFGWVRHHRAGGEILYTEGAVTDVEKGAGTVDFSITLPLVGPKIDDYLRIGAELAPMEALRPGVATPNDFTSIRVDLDIPRPN